MEDQELYQQILGLKSPWEVERVELDHSKGEIRVHVAHEGGCAECPECGEAGSWYGARERRWRHLDTCQYTTILIAQVPRVKCSEHGVHQVGVAWSEPGSRFTALFECMAINWLKEASVSAVSEQLGLSWEEVDGIQQRAVKRGLGRREIEQPKRLGIDETSFQKRHEYVTVIHDLDRKIVLDVLNDRTQKTLEQGLLNLGEDTLKGVEAVAMDMWKPFINAVKEVVPEGERKIAFDKFHVAKHLGDAVNTVRRQEHKMLSEEGDDTLKGSRFIWLREGLDKDEQRRLDSLKEVAIRTARAWSIRHFAMNIWYYNSRRWAKKAWGQWYGWAMRSRLEPIKKVARMIKTHLEGIINAIVLKVTNAQAEATNASIQMIKRRARGFRNRERFRTVILFNLGGLDLYPKPS